MKKIILLVLSVYACIVQTEIQAQNSFQKGDVVLSPGIGLGSNYPGAGFRGSIIFNADFGIHEYVSIGPYTGATFFSGATGLDFGARASFHWWQLLDEKVDSDLLRDQLDIYSTIWLGGEIIPPSNAGRGFDAGFTQGIRWYPNANNRIALFGEFGWTPISFSSIGASIKMGR